MPHDEVIGAIRLAGTTVLPEVASWAPTPSGHDPDSRTP
jgi:hypothetical protein